MDKIATSIPRQKSKKSFYVGHDIRLPEGGKLIASPLSGLMHTRFQLKKALKRIRRRCPDARGVVAVSFY